METKNVKELGDCLFNKDFENFIDKQPYMAFVVMSALLEFLAKVYSKETPNQITNNTEENCYKAINNIISLKKYVVFNEKVKTKKGEKNTNKLYTCLRCGMLHSLIPDKGVFLTSKDNNLEKKVIGATELYRDLHGAWEELKKNTEHEEYLGNDVLTITNILSAETPTNISEVQ